MVHDADRDEECERWIAAVKNGNQQSLEILYDKYSPALFGIIIHITGDQKLAEETLTKTFIKAWRKVVTLHEGQTSLFMWLINIARQAACDAVRSAQVNSACTENNLHEDASAFDLVYYKGLSYAEAGDLLKIPVEEVIINFRMKIKALQDKIVTI